MELEAVFLKACRLLRSKAKESTEQLRQLLEESLHHNTSSSSSSSSSSSLLTSSLSLVSDSTAAAAATSSSSSPYASKVETATSYHGKVLSSSNLVKKQSPKHVSVEQKTKPSGTTGGGGNSSNRDVEETSKKLLEKRTYDKVKQQEVSHLDRSGSDQTKRQRIDQQPPQKPVVGRQSPAVYSPSSSSSSSSSVKDVVGHGSTTTFEANASASDIAVEFGLVCVLCRSFDVSSGNTLVECQDCHALYHQECHKPPITDRDVNDPRLVWYCAKCTKNMKKMASKTQKPVKPQTVSLTKEPTAATKPNKQMEVTTPTASQQPTHIFKRVEPKVAASSAIHPPTSTGNKPIGLAGLAASLSGKSQKPIQSSSQKPNTSSLKVTLTASKPTQPTGNVKTGGTFANLYSSSNKSTFQSGNNGGSSSVSSVGGGNGGYTSSSSSGRSTSVSAGSSSSVAAPASIKPSGSSIAGGNGSSSSAAGTLTAAASKSGGGGGGGGGSGGVGAGTSSSSIMSADKRLQIMKKKAAAKMQEKRRVSSK